MTTSVRTPVDPLEKREMATATISATPTISRHGKRACFFFHYAQCPHGDLCKDEHILLTGIDARTLSQKISRVDTPYIARPPPQAFISALDGEARRILVVRHLEEKRQRQEAIDALPVSTTNPKDASEQGKAVPKESLQNLQQPLHPEFEFRESCRNFHYAKCFKGDKCDYNHFFVDGSNAKKQYKNIRSVDQHYFPLNLKPMRHPHAVAEKYRLAYLAHCELRKKRETEDQSFLARRPSSKCNDDVEPTKALKQVPAVNNWACPLFHNETCPENDACKLRHTMLDGTDAKQLEQKIAKVDTPYLAPRMLRYPHAEAEVFRRLKHDPLHSEVAPTRWRPGQSQAQPEQSKVRPTRKRSLDLPQNEKERSVRPRPSENSDSNREKLSVSSAANPAPTTSAASKSPANNCDQPGGVTYACYFFHARGRNCLRGDACFKSHVLTNGIDARTLLQERTYVDKVYLSARSTPYTSVEAEEFRLAFLRRQAETQETLLSVSTSGPGDGLSADSSNIMQDTAPVASNDNLEAMQTQNATNLDSYLDVGMLASNADRCQAAEIPLDDGSNFGKSDDQHQTSETIEAEKSTDITEEEQIEVLTRWLSGMAPALGRKVARVLFDFGIESPSRLNGLDPATIKELWDLLSNKLSTFDRFLLKTKVFPNV